MQPTTPPSQAITFDGLNCGSQPDSCKAVGTNQNPQCFSTNPKIGLQYGKEGNVDVISQGGCAFATAVLPPIGFLESIDFDVERTRDADGKDICPPDAWVSVYAYPRDNWVSPPGCQGTRLDPIAGHDPCVRAELDFMENVSLVGHYEGDPQKKIENADKKYATFTQFAGDPWLAWGKGKDGDLQSFGTIDWDGWPDGKMHVSVDFVKQDPDKFDPGLCTGYNVRITHCKPDEVGSDGRCPRTKCTYAAMQPTDGTTCLEKCLTGEILEQQIQSPLVLVADYWANNSIPTDPDAKHTTPGCGLKITGANYTKTAECGNENEPCCAGNQCHIPDTWGFKPVCQNGICIDPEQRYTCNKGAGICYPYAGFPNYTKKDCEDSC